MGTSHIAKLGITMKKPRKQCPGTGKVPMVANSKQKFEWGEARDGYDNRYTEKQGITFKWFQAPILHISEHLTIYIYSHSLMPGFLI